MNLLKRVEELERVAVRPGDVVGVQASPEIGVPELERSPGETVDQLVLRARACVKWPAEGCTIVRLRNAE